MPGFSYDIFYNPFIILAIVIEAIIKAIALWRCGRNNQPYWFIALLIINSAGIIPLIYLLFFQRKKSLYPRL